MIYLIGKQVDIPGVQNCTLEYLNNYFKDKTEIQLDTETTGFDPYINKLLTVQFGDYENQFVVEIKDENTIDGIRPLLERKDVLFLLQNAKFDLRFLYHHNIFIHKLYDTFLVELILQTGIERNQLHVALDDIVWNYCNVKLDKTIRGNINIEGLTPRVIKYAADDVKYLSLAKKHQLRIVKKYKLEQIVDLENEVTKVFALMEYNGVSFNSEKWLEVADITNKERKRLEKELDDIVINDPKLKRFSPNAIQINIFDFQERLLSINWGSSQQKLDILHELNIDADSTGDRVLQRNKNKHLLIKTLIAYNKHKKLNDAFGTSFLEHVNPRTKKLHMNIWPIVSSGRISVSDPNLNQIPSKGDLAKTIRSCFIPSKGYKIVGGDYSGFELRIIAEYSQDPIWLKAFREDKDLHSELTALTFGIDIKDVKKPFPPKPDLTYRDVQKTVDFGLAYGMSYFKLSDTIQVSEDEAKRIIKQFFSVVPQVEKCLNKLGQFGKEHGYIRTDPYFNRLRWFPEWEQTKDQSNGLRMKILGEIERASKNTPFQGTNANIIKYALINVQNEINLNNWPVRILLSIYDEIVTECEEYKAEDWCKKLEEIMIESAKVVIKTIPVKADCKISDYWQK